MHGIFRRQQCKEQNQKQNQRSIFPNLPERKQISVGEKKKNSLRAPAFWKAEITLAPRNSWTNDETAAAPQGFVGPHVCTGAGLSMSVQKQTYKIPMVHWRLSVVNPHIHPRRHSQWCSHVLDQSVACVFSQPLSNSKSACGTLWVCVSMCVCFVLLRPLKGPVATEIRRWWFVELTTSPQPSAPLIFLKFGQSLCVVCVVVAGRLHVLLCPPSPPLSQQVWDPKEKANYIKKISLHLCFVGINHFFAFLLSFFPLLWLSDIPRPFPPSQNPPLRAVTHAQAHMEVLLCWPMPTPSDIASDSSQRLKIDATFPGHSSAPHLITLRNNLGEAVIPALSHIWNESERAVLMKVSVNIFMSLVQNDDVWTDWKIPIQTVMWKLKKHVPIPGTAPCEPDVKHSKTTVNGGWGGEP